MIVFRKKKESVFRQQKRTIYIHNIFTMKSNKFCVKKCKWNRLWCLYLSIFPFEILINPRPLFLAPFVLRQGIVFNHLQGKFPLSTCLTNPDISTRRLYFTYWNILFSANATFSLTTNENSINVYKEIVSLWPNGITYTMSRLSSFVSFLPFRLSALMQKREPQRLK